MATVFLRTGLRSIMSKSALEKRIVPSFCSVFTNDEQNRFETTSTSQYSRIARRFYSKRNVHHTRSSTRSTSLNEKENKFECDSDSDSDSDSERGQSEFWRRKMRTLHSHLDVNKDGVVSYDDFMLLADRFSELDHLSPEAKKEFKKLLQDMWEEQWGDISPYNFISVETYLEEMVHVLNDSELNKKCHHFLPYLFKAVDKDHSGEISVEEFKIFFKCLGLTSDHAVVTFSHIDTNDDGKISLEEFVTLGRNFFISEDHMCPSKHFWGPLVN